MARSRLCSRRSGTAFGPAHCASWRPAPVSTTSMRTLVHLSDLHFGRIDASVVDPLIEIVRDLTPDVVVISGDLTQRARSYQFVEAARFLSALPQPQIVVPGNHDVPLRNVFS